MKANFIGRVFGDLVVLRHLGSDEHQKIRWLCRCKCGQKLSIPTSNLSSGASTRCKTCACSIDLTGRTFGRLTVVRWIRKNGRMQWLCICVCGKQSITRSDALRGGFSKSCGCLHRETLISNNANRIIKHGHARKHKTSKTYASWKAMLGRCKDHRNSAWASYGGKGIKVCKRWQGLHGFENFLADMGARPQGKTLDRYPNRKGNYTPSNCRWATPREQRLNQKPYRIYQGRVVCNVRKVA